MACSVPIPSKMIRSLIYIMLHKPIILSTLVVSLIIAIPLPGFKPIDVIIIEKDLLASLLLGSCFLSNKDSGTRQRNCRDRHIILPVSMNKGIERALSLAPYLFFLPLIVRGAKDLLLLPLHGETKLECKHGN